MAFFRGNFLTIALGTQFLKVCSNQRQHLQKNYLKTSGVISRPHNQKTDSTQSDGSKKVQKKRKQALMITLFQNENMTVVSLEEASNLAKRRSMHLVKVQDMDFKTQRPVYKILTASEMLQEELSEINRSDKSAVGATKRSDKSLNINSRIGEHDLNARKKNICKWLNKQHEVRILIQASSEQDQGSCEKIFKSISEAITNPQVIGKIVQKRVKGNVMKFTIIPVTAPTNDPNAAKDQ